MSTETNSNRGLLMSICILLAAILATNIWSIVQDMLETSQAELRSELRMEEIESIRINLDLQSLRAQTLLSSYEIAAYGNSSIDRISEQQLLAAEAQLSGLEAIAAQNQMIAELLLLPYTEPEANGPTADSANE